MSNSISIKTYERGVSYMQINISFTSDKDIVLPIHHNNIVQAFIYNNIDDKLAKLLHDGGYSSNGRSFKLFAFSRILGRVKKENDKFNFGRVIEVAVSSPLDHFCKSIANNMLLNNDLFLGQNKIKTEAIQINNQTVDKDEIVVETLSGIVVYSTFIKPDNSKYTCYFMPMESDFNRLITDNLIRKYNALYNKSIEGNIEVIPLNLSKQNITYYKKTIVKGASGKFLIKGPKELLQIGLDTGFGSKNSQGFGCVKMV